MTIETNAIDLIQQFISDHTSEDKVAERINIFETVRDFTYQINGATTPEKLLACKEGYCASKHRLLKAVYEKLWYHAELCFVPFTFDMAYLPENLKGRWLATKKWYHVFLKLWIDGKWIDIDATYNKELKEFYVINQNRDWISSQKMICETQKIYIPKTQDEEWEIKKKLSDPEGFTDKDRKRVEEYNTWIKSVPAHPDSLSQ